jgi:hypothetical protein
VRPAQLARQQGRLALLHRRRPHQAQVPLPSAVAVAVHYKHADGSVTSENIDSNFIRTVMHYGRSLTQGARVEPWQPTISLGAVVDGACLQFHLHTAQVCSGRLLFDTPRPSKARDLPLVRSSFTSPTGRSIRR